MTLVDDIRNHYYRHYGCYPDLDNPSTYDEKIAWLKLYNHEPLAIILVDKLRVKDYLSTKIPNNIVPITTTYPMVIKANNSWNDLQFVYNSEEEKEAELFCRQKALSRSHGRRTGEWVYRCIKPAVFKEKKLEIEDVEYRFHFSHGNLKWCELRQSIYSSDDPDYRDKVIFYFLDNDGNAFNINYPDNPPSSYEISSNPPFDTDFSIEKFLQCKRLAEQIVIPDFQYVRVDFCYAEGKPWFSEYTFFPGGGISVNNYVIFDGVPVGDFIDLDISIKKKQIIR